MFKKLLCMGSVVMGSAYGADGRTNIPYWKQAIHTKPNHTDSLKLAHAVAMVQVWVSRSENSPVIAATVPVTAETTIGDMKEYLITRRLLVENKALYATYAQWYEAAKLADVIHFEAPLQDTEKVHDVIARYIHPPYINEIEFTFTLNPKQ